MAQMDMVPENVQQGAMAVNNDISELREILNRIEKSFNELDQIWVSEEKNVIKTVAFADIAELKEKLEELESFGKTALDIANHRIERDNNFTKLMN